MAGISLGKCPSSKIITFYNPKTRSYYNPPSYRLYKARHPSPQFPCHIKYYGTMILGLYCNKRNPTPKHSLPGPRIPLLRNR